MDLRCLSYNIHSCFGTDGKYSPERIRDVILESGADIVALQEIDSSLDVVDGTDQLRFLTESTKMFSVIGPTLKRGYGAYGNALLSRFPIREISERDLTYRRFEPRGVLEAKIEIGGLDIAVINTHLGLKWWERKFQVAKLIDTISDRGPQIVMGDFNEWFRWSSNLRKLKRALRSCGDLKTFPARWPRLCLDRIFVSEIPVRQVCTISTPLTRVASDHLPVLAELEILR